MVDTCIQKIVELMKDNKERTTYEISKKIGYSYGATHNYMKQLIAQNKLKESRRDKSHTKATRIYYVLDANG